MFGKKEKQPMSLTNREVYGDRWCKTCKCNTCGKKNVCKNGGKCGLFAFRGEGKCRYYREETKKC